MPETGATAPARRQDIEAVRLLAAFGIVAFHGGAWGSVTVSAIAYGGLMVFLMLTLWLSPGAAEAQRRGWRQLAVARARRLLLPWALWFLFYGLARVLDGGAFLELAQPWRAAGYGELAALTLGALAGTSIHLWYLPFVFAALTVLDELKARLPAGWLTGAGAAAALLGLATAAWWRPATLDLPYPLLQWADAGVAVGAGLLLWGRPAWPLLRWRLAAAAVLAAALAVVLLNPGAPGTSAVARGFAIAVGVGFAVCWALAEDALRALRRLNCSPWAEATFGLYLSHSFFQALLLRHGRLPDALLPLAVFTAALLFAVGLRRLRPGAARWWS